MRKLLLLRKYFKSCFHPSNEIQNSISEIEIRLNSLENKLKKEIKEESELKEMNSKLDDMKTQLNNFHKKTDHELQTTSIRLACLTEEVKMASDFYLQKYDNVE